MRLSTFWRRRIAMLPVAAANHARRARQWNLMVGVLAAATLLSPTLYLSGARADDATTKPARKPAPKDAPSAALRVELPGGAVAEIVAVAEHPSRGGPWWGADGELTAAPYQKIRSSVTGNGNGNELLREICVRWIRRPEKGKAASWSVVGGGSSGRGSPIDADGHKIDDLDAVARAFPSDTKVCSIRFETSEGPWQTLADTDGRNASAMGDARHSYAFSPATGYKGDRVISAAHTVLDSEIRIVAIDPDGKIFQASAQTTVGGRGFRQTTCTFAGLTDKPLKEFQLQARGKQIVEVHNISLLPGVNKEPKIVHVPKVEATQK